METRTMIGAAILLIVALEGLWLLWKAIVDRRRRRRWAKKTSYIYIAGTDAGTGGGTD